jgi:hypothetical protein
MRERPLGTAPDHVILWGPESYFGTAGIGGMRDLGGMRAASVGRLVCPKTQVHHQAQG